MRTTIYVLSSTIAVGSAILLDSCSARSPSSDNAIVATREAWRSQSPNSWFPPSGIDPERELEADWSEAQLSALICGHPELIRISPQFQYWSLSSGQIECRGERSYECIRMQLSRLDGLQSALGESCDGLRSEAARFASQQCSHADGVLRCANSFRVMTVGGDIVRIDVLIDCRDEHGRRSCELVRLTSWSIPTE